ncbi:MAG: ATP-binding protein [Bacteroidota bacterium]
MIRRTIYPELLSHLDNPRISVLIGPRQVGKTTLIRQLEKHLKENGKRTLYLNLDTESDFRLVRTQTELLQRIKLEVGEDSATVFIDEIQRKENAGKFLKGIYDQNLPYKFVVTGSGSLELKASVSESLAGRKRVFEISPISFAEFFDYRTDYRYEGKISEYFALESIAAGVLLQEYLSFGGYPDVIIAETQKEKQILIDELFTAYVDRDIVSLLGIERRQAFVLMLRLLADRQGQPMNYTKLANEVNLSVATLKNYLEYAEQTFIIKSVNPYFSNTGKSLVKASQYYFLDLGLAAYARGTFSYLAEDDPKIGYVFQHFVFQLLRDIADEKSWILQYWRTRDGAEVDFILNAITEVYPIEVKWSNKPQRSVTRSMRSFVTAHHPNRAFVAQRFKQHYLDKPEGIEAVPWHTLKDIFRQ